MDRYGIIETKQVHIPGDERSRTNPGHGYPAHTKTYSILIEYDSREEWENAIRQKANPLYGCLQQFRAIVFKEAAISTEVKVNIE